MRKKEEKNTIIEICPVRNVIARFGNKWALLVILILSEHEVLRFSELGKLIPDVSARVLSGTLRTLEADGLVNRKVYPEVPPKVEYSLTETGHSLVPFIVQLTDWAQKHMKSIVKHREEFEAAEEEQQLLSSRKNHLLPGAGSMPSCISMLKRSGTPCSRTILPSFSS